MCIWRSGTLDDATHVDTKRRYIGWSLSPTVLLGSPTRGL